MPTGWMDRPQGVFRCALQLEVAIHLQALQTLTGLVGQFWVASLEGYDPVTYSYGWEVD